MLKFGLAHQLSLDKDIKTQIRTIPSNGITELNGVPLREVFPHGEYFLVSTDFYTPETEAVVVARAKKHLKDNRFNLVVIHPGCKNNPMLVITPEGGVVPLDTNPNSLSAFIDGRALSTRFKSVLDTNMQSTAQIAEHNKELTPGFSMYNVTLNLAHSLNLLPDESGYVSANMKNGQALISPRQVDKSILALNEAVITQLDGTHILYNDEYKPSTDSGMCLKVYNAYPEMKSILHFHNEWGFIGCHHQIPYPCGTVQEADVAVKSLDANRESFVLPNHGAVFCFDSYAKIAQTKTEYESAVEAFDEHLDDIRAEIGTLPFEMLRVNYKPIFVGTKVIGIIYDDGTYVVPYILPEHRGTGVGSHLIRQIKDRYRTVATTDACGVLDYYLGHGFKIVRTNGKLIELKYVR